MEKPEDVIKKGDQPKAMVISLDKESKKIALSIKAVGSAEESGSVKKYNANTGVKSATLADKLKGFSVTSDVTASSDDKEGTEEEN